MGMGMGMGMQEVVGKHEREGANWAAEAARAAAPAGNNAMGDDFANKEGRGNGIIVSPSAPPSSEGWVGSSVGSSSSGGAGNEASASSENGMPASSSEYGSQQPRRWGEGRADRSYHGMHSSMSSLTHGSSFGASTSASSSGISGGGGEANRSSAYGGSSSDGNGNDASQGRDFYVDASGSPRLCRGSGGKKRRVHYGERGVEALLSGALSLSSSSHSSMSGYTGGSSSGGGSGEDVAGNDHGNGKGHEEDAGVISDSQHHHQCHHHQHRRDLPLDEERNSLHLTGDDSRTKPKGPMSAYNFFFIDEQEKILAEYPASPLAWTDCAGRKRSNRVIRFEELDKEIGQRWRDIGSDTLKKYAHMAEKDTARYRRELNDYYDENDAQRHSQILSEIRQGADDRLDTEASGLAQGIPRLSNSIRAGHARSESSLTLSAPLTHAAVEKNMASNSMPSAQELFVLLQQRNLLPTSSVVDGCIVGRNLTNAYSGDLAVAGVGLTGPSYNSTGQITQMMAPLQSSFAPKYQDALGLLHSNGASSNGLDTQISPNGNGILLQTTPTAAPSPASLPLDNALLQIYAAQHGLNPAILQAAVMRQNGASCSSGFQGSMNNE